MYANLLTLNSSKTEFLIIDLKQQLSKIDNSSLNTTHSARNIGFIFDEHLTFSDQISSLSKSCYSHIRELQPLFHIYCMHHLTCGISSLLHSVNLIVFTVLVHLILRISPCLLYTSPSPRDRQKSRMPSSA